MSNITQAFLEILGEASSIQQCASAHGKFTFNGICALLWYHAVKEVGQLIKAYLEHRKRYKRQVDDSQSTNSPDLSPIT